MRIFEVDFDDNTQCFLIFAGSDQCTGRFVARWGGGNAIRLQGLQSMVVAGTFQCYPPRAVRPVSFSRAWALL
jgi:hypothetical protein